MAWQNRNPTPLVSVILLLVLCLSGFTLDLVHASVDSQPTTYNYWIDPNLGNDANDGSLEHPFATMQSLYRLSNDSEPTDVFIVNLSPLTHIFNHFSYRESNSWTFQTCIICPKGVVATGMAELAIVPFPDQQDPANFACLRSSRAQSYGTALNFRYIVLRPHELEDRDSIFRTAVFAPEDGGISIKYCVVKSFTFSKLSSSLIRGPTSQMILRNSNFEDLTMWPFESFQPHKTEDFSPIIGQGEITDIRNSLFTRIKIKGGTVVGGILVCISGQLSVHNSSFISNQGEAYLFGLGLNIFASSTCDLTVEDSTFADNTFRALKVSPSVIEPPDLYSDSTPRFNFASNNESSIEIGVTNGAAIGIASASFGKISIVNTAFVRNEAIQGSAIASIADVGAGYVGGYAAAAELKIEMCTFARNNATSGVAPAILIQGGLLNSLIATSNTFDSNYVPKDSSQWRKRYTGISSELGEMIDPSLVLMSEVATGAIKIENTTIKETHDLAPPQTSQDDQTAFNTGDDTVSARSLAWRVGFTDSVHINRIIFSRCANLKLSGWLFDGVGPLPGFGGSFLQIHSITGDLILRNIEIRAPKVEYAFTDYILIVVDSDPDVKISLLASRSLDGFLISDWVIGDSTMVALAVRDIPSFFLQDITFDQVNSNSQPLIMIQNTETVSIANTSLIDSSATIQVMYCDNVYLNNITIRASSTSKAVVSLESILNATVSNFRGRGSISPFLFISQFIYATIVDSSFSEASIFTADGAVTLDSPYATILVSKTNFSKNTALRGGGIYVSSIGRLHIDRSIFEDNLVFNKGGAVEIGEHCALEITSTAFTNNAALGPQGGAISTECTINKITMSIFAFNKAMASGAEGGAISASGNARTPVTANTLSIEESTFHDNQAAHTGGAIYTQLSTIIKNTSFFFNNAENGGAVFASTESPLQVSNCGFTGNKALNGGALSKAFDKEHSLTLESSSFRINEATAGPGGAILLYLADEEDSPDHTIPPVISGCEFYFNTAEWGGAISSSVTLALTSSNQSSQPQQPNEFMDNLAKSVAGAIFLPQSAERWPLIQGQRFYNNRASGGGGVLAFGGLPSSPFSPDWKKSFLESNTFYGPDQKILPLGTKVSLLSEYRPLSSSNGDDQTDQQLNPFDPSTPPLILFPGVPTVLNLMLVDELGQRAEQYYKDMYGSLEYQSCYSLDASGLDPVQNGLLVPDCHRVQSAGTITPITESFEQNGVQVKRQTGLQLSLLLTLTSSNLTMDNPLNSTLTGVFSLNLRWMASHPQLFLRRSTFEIRLSPCGYGTGLRFGSSSCQACPLDSFSFHGICQSCTDNPHVWCHGGTIGAENDYWVSGSLERNSYHAIRCPPGFCRASAIDSIKARLELDSPSNLRSPFVNLCSAGRTGALCGECIAPLGTSITTSCIHCSKPNWVMIFAVLAGLWIGVIILHALVAVSSGKATILIFFIQTSFVINYQIPITDIFGLKKSESNLLPSSLQFLLCLMPLNPLERGLLIGVVPFIMMTMLTITFLVRWLCIILIKCCRREHVTAPPPLTTDLSIPYGFTDIVSDDDNLSKEETDGLISAVEEAWADSINKHPISDETHGIDRVQLDPVLRADADRFQDVYRWQTESAFFHPSRLIRTILSLMAGSFSSVLGIATLTMDCIVLLDGRRVLQSAPSVSCDSSQFRLFRNLNGLFIPYMAFVFMALLVKLVHAYWNDRLTPTDVRFGVWYEMYKPRFFAWKLTEMLKRLVISIVAKLLLSVPTGRSLALSGLCMLFLTIHLMSMPYKQTLENQLETLSAAGLAVMSLATLWNSRSLESATGDASTFATTLAWLTTIIISIIIAGAFAVKKLSGQNNIRSRFLRLFHCCSTSKDQR